MDDLIPLGGLTVLYGIGKGGKTTLLTYLAASIIGGTPFLGRDVTPGHVLWVDLEQHPALTSATLSDAGAIDQDNAVHVYNGPTPSLSSIEAKANSLGAVAIVVDSLSKLLQLRDENDASEVTRAMTPVLELARSTNASVIVIHHDRKREGIAAARALRGSSAFLAVLDVGIALKKESGQDERRRLLECTSRYPEVNGLTLSVRLDDGGFVVENEVARLVSSEAVAKLASEVLTIDEWAKRLNLTRTALLSRANRLVGEGVVCRDGKGVRGDPFRYYRKLDSDLSAPVPTGAAECGINS